jgi:autotransporter-associated beta strand protein
MERLEERVVLSTLHWSGADASASNNNWSDKKNWQETQAPASGDTLIFPSGPTGLALTSNDDLSGKTFADLTIAGGGYTITGSTGVTLTVTGAIDASQASGSSTINPPVTLTASPGTITVDNTTAGLVMGGAVTAANGLAKQGPGVLDLKGTNAITGTTTVTMGALLVDGKVGAVAVDSGATIGGSGTVGSITATAGTVSPGDSSTLTGILTDTGPMTLTGSSNFDVTINGTTVRSQYDQVSAGGAVDLTGATLNVAVPSFVPTVGQQFTILHNTSGSPVTGTFTGLAEGATLTAAGYDFSITYKGTTSNPNDVILTAVSPPTVTWTGADASASTPNDNWSDDNNWASPTGSTTPHHPVAGDTVIFPSTVNGTPVTGKALTSNNDIPNTIFNSIQVQASGYVIQGVGVGLAGSIDASQATGTSTIFLPITFNQGVGTVTVVNSGATLLLTDTVAAPSGLTKAGSGTLGLEADNGSLAAVVNAGTLEVDGTAGDISVNAGATLSGTGGKVAEIATTHATLSPGVSSTTGILTDSGNLVMDASSTFAATLNQPATGTPQAGTDYDQLIAGGSSSTVNLAGSTLSITAASSITSGEQFTILHNTSGSPVVGTFAGLAEGAQLTVSTNKQFSISYKGGTNHQDVVLTSLIATTTTVGSIPTGLVSGQSVTLTATVAHTTGTGTLTGTVDFKSGTTDLGTATLSGGKATLTTTQLTAGTNSITATYSGDTAFGSSTSPAVTAVVGQASSTTTVSASPNPSVNGQPVTLTALVSAVAPGTGTPTGSVTFFNGSTNLGTANLAVGVATLVTTALPPGTNAITAKYTGGTNFTASTSTPFNIVVNQGNAAVSLTASDTNPFALVPITLTVIVSATTGAGTPTGTVTFQTAGGTTLGTATLSSGTATLTTGTIPLGAQSITAVYSGNSTFTTATSRPLAVTIGHPNDLYVNQIYQDIFGIPADLGATYWIALLNGGYSPKVVARDILKSAGARVAAVESVFQSLLGRPATSKELKRALASGATSTTPVYIQVFGSEEYYLTRGHGTNEGFLAALATDWFGAPFSASVQARLLRQLDRGVSRTKIARDVITGPSGVSAQVNTIFEAVLERPATTKDQKQFGPLVRQGNLVEVYSTLFASKEFKALIKAQ